MSPAQTRGEHTPGPWTMEREWNEGEHYAITARLSKTAHVDTRGIVANLKHTPWIEQAEANARLIAAAPELLEACLDALDKASDIDGFDETKLRAAIARASAGQEGK